MSGFEALGLACSIFQVISFGLEAVRTCKEIYNKSRAPDDYLDDKATSMINAISRVEQYLQSPSVSIQPSDPNHARYDAQLLKTAANCREVAKELQYEVQAILNSKGNRLWRAILTTAKSAAKASKLEKLKQRLRTCQETMETQMRAREWWAQNARDLQHQSYFTKLDADVKGFVMQLAAGQTTTNELISRDGTVTRDHISLEVFRSIEVINEHVTSSMSRQDAQKKKDEQRERLLESLRFPGMGSRRAQILDDSTFETIFRPAPQSNVPKKILHESSFIIWKSFETWLRSCDKLFWVTGKPGSGKSTLVKYLVKDGRTKRALQEWQPDVVILSHFFWKLGTDLQKSAKGLLGSVLYHLLYEIPSYVDLILAKGPTPGLKRTLEDWSLKELRDLFLSLQHEHCTPICLFIDGLDEISDDEGTGPLLQIIEQLKALPHIKLCLSSRPDWVFQTRFESSPHMKLHEIMYPDMKLFVEQQLEPLVDTSQLDKAAYNLISETLPRRAEGVFLWLMLASRSVQLGAENGDSYDLLISRVNHLPPKLEDLYSDMWNRLITTSPMYAAYGARCFNAIIFFKYINDRNLHRNITFRSRPELLTLLNVTIALNPTLVDEGLSTNFSHSEISRRSEEFRIACGKARRNIRVHSGGLLQVMPSSDQKDEEDQLFSFEVEFIHRTAYDFLVRTESGREILNSDSSWFESGWLNCYRCILCLWPFTQTPVPRPGQYWMEETLPVLILSIRSIYHTTCPVGHFASSGDPPSISLKQLNQIIDSVPSNAALDTLSLDHRDFLVSRVFALVSSSSLFLPSVLKRLSKVGGPRRARMAEVLLSTFTHKECVSTWKFCKEKTLDLGGCTNLVTAGFAHPEVPSPDLVQGLLACGLAVNQRQPESMYSRAQFEVDELLSGAGYCKYSSCFEDVVVKAVEQRYAYLRQAARAKTVELITHFINAGGDISRSLWLVCSDDSKQLFPKFDEDGFIGGDGILVVEVNLSCLLGHIVLCMEQDTSHSHCSEAIRSIIQKTRPTCRAAFLATAWQSQHEAFRILDPEPFSDMVDGLLFGRTHGFPFETLRQFAHDITICQRLDADLFEYMAQRKMSVVAKPGTEDV